MSLTSARSSSALMAGGQVSAGTSTWLIHFAIDDIVALASLLSVVVGVFVCLFIVTSPPPIVAIASSTQCTDTWESMRPQTSSELGGKLNTRECNMEWP